ncbi:MAG: hypothetical protein EAZ88_18110, partial [Oscillatoriales cyanobacterium]
HKLEGLEGYLNVPLSPFWVGPNPRRFSPGEVQNRQSYKKSSQPPDFSLGMQGYSSKIDRNSS